MSVRLVVQSRTAPDRILRALQELASPSVNEIRIAVAYVTYAGARLLCGVLATKMGDAHWPTIQKTLVTSVDYGLTDPAALTYWSSSLSNATVLLQNIELLPGATLIPSRAFHAKHYEFRRVSETSFATGSANLTENALTSNTEILAVRTNLKPSSALDGTWEQLSAGAIPVTSPLISNYQKVRKKVTPPPEPSAIPDVDHKPPESLWQAIESGACDPGTYENFWVDAGSMKSGGAHNQLELPRGANRFFGFGFNAYGPTHDAIGNVGIIVEGQQYSNRPLSWHGDNGMERLNLPTGYDYSNMVIMFSRRDVDAFDMIVVPSDSNRAHAWKEAAAQSESYFRVGGVSPRTCGLF